MFLIGFVLGLAVAVLAVLAVVVVTNTTYGFVCLEDNCVFAVRYDDEYTVHLISSDHLWDAHGLDQYDKHN